MDNYLVDRETLGQFADALIKAKYGSEQSNQFNQSQNQGQQQPQPEREDVVRALDQHVTNAVFGSLSEHALAELSQLLDDDTADESTFANFFEKKSGINLNQTIKQAFETFRNEFLGGANA